MDVVYRGAQVLDELGSFTGPCDVHVKDGVIAKVGQSIRAKTAVDVDLDGHWWMPGIFDCHTHVAFHSRDERQNSQTPVTRWAINTAHALTATLRCGVTFVRDAGGLEAGVISAVSDGLISSPTVQSSIVLLSHMGGQMDGYQAGAGREQVAAYLIPDYPGRPPMQVDGVQEVQIAVRRIIRAGADWIKLVIGGPPLGTVGDPNASIVWSVEEINAAVHEATRLGRPVMADAKTTATMAACIRAGVRSLEHGNRLDESTAELMVQNGVWLVPTLMPYDRLESSATEPADVERWREMRAKNVEAITMAKALGVQIALGSDASVAEMHGANLMELTHLRKAGLSLEDVLLAATVSGARLCGVEDTYGRIAPGYTADALILDREPSQDDVLGDGASIRTVLKSGIPIPAPQDVIFPSKSANQNQPRLQ